MACLHVFRPVFLCLLGGVLIGCAGYQVGNIPSSAMSGVRTIYVPVARNLTLEPGLPVMTTNAIIRRLENDGTYASARTGVADAELTVTLTEFERIPIRRSRDDVTITTQYRAVLKAKVTLVNRVTGAVVIKDRIIAGATEYLVQGDAVEAERQALPLVAQDLATRIVSAVAEGW
ncbi:MAG: hypothetical protein OHK005_04960 [Candidatus Methylacidiphilales bacterium]